MSLTLLTLHSIRGALVGPYLQLSSSKQNVTARRHSYSLWLCQGHALQRRYLHPIYHSPSGSSYRGIALCGWRGAAEWTCPITKGHFSLALSMMGPPWQGVGGKGDTSNKPRSGPASFPPDTDHTTLETGIKKISLCSLFIQIKWLFINPSNVLRGHRLF